MAKAFEEAREKGNFVLEDFGTIIESGEGILVPVEVQRRMERDYGVNHDYEKQLLMAIEAAKRQDPNTIQKQNP